MNAVFHTVFSPFHSLFRKPGFAIAVIVILVLGIGINVATLGLLYRYYVAPLPYPQGGKIVTVHVTTKLGPYGMSIPAWQILQKKVPALTDSAIYNSQGYNLVLGSREAHLNGTEATASVFTTLGVQPLLGHVFGKQSTRPGAQPVTVLSYRLWQILFEGKSSAIGSTLRLNGKLYTVIGVMPRAFNFPNSQTELWTPRVLTADDQNPGNFTSFLEQMVGRLAANVPASSFMIQANTALAPKLGNNLLNVRVVAQGWRASQVDSLHQSLILVLFAAALLMLLVWFNLANLALARSLARRGEFALRRALGASSARLVLALALENFILSILGAVGGVVLGRVLLNLFSGSSVAVNASSLGAASWYALVPIALVLALISTAIFTAMSASFLRGNNLAAALGEAGTRASAGRGSKRVRVSLIAGQIALACTIVGTGLLLGRGLLNLNAVNLGFDPNQVTTFKLSFPEAQYSLERMAPALSALRMAVVQQPGITAASLSSNVPFDGAGGTGNIAFSRPASSSVHPSTFPVVTDAGYLETLGITLIRGRDFTPVDEQSGATVAIIDALAAKQLFGTEDAVGREFSFYSPDDNEAGVLFRVIGVASTTHRTAVGAAVKYSTVYVPYSQVYATRQGLWFQRDFYLTVRSSLPTATVISEVQNVAHNVVPGVPLYEVQTMNQRVAASLASNRLLTVLVLLFAVGALVLAAVGLYALQAYAVTQRMREFAIRAALGANRSRLLALVLGETARLLVIGLVVGLAGLAAIGVAFASAFYGIGAVDPAGMAIVVIVLALAALAASWFPAWRASRVPPMVALRE